MDNIISAAKRMPLNDNVCIRVIDQTSGQVVCEHTGHNSATDLLVGGIAHYLAGEGVINQGYEMLSSYLPRYISLGTMGLINQLEDANHLPLGLGEISYVEDGWKYSDLDTWQLSILNKQPLSQLISVSDGETLQLVDYILHRPGYGADGHDAPSGYPSPNNNDRLLLGLGQAYDLQTRPHSSKSINCELVSNKFPRVPITYRYVETENNSQYPNSRDVILSGMISTGALTQFKESGKDYIFITEAGLWADNKVDYLSEGERYMLAGYRLMPRDASKLDLRYTAPVSANKQAIKKSIIRVGVNQIVQVIWKIQINGLGDIEKTINSLYPKEM